MLSVLTPKVMYALQADAATMAPRKVLCPLNCPKGSKECCRTLLTIVIRLLLAKSLTSSTSRKRDRTRLPQQATFVHQHLSPTTVEKTAQQSQCRCITRPRLGPSAPPQEPPQRLNPEGIRRLKIVRRVVSVTPPPDRVLTWPQSEKAWAQEDLAEPTTDLEDRPLHRPSTPLST